MAAPSNADFVRQLAARVAAGEPAAVATVVRIHGSASARPGAKAIIDAQGRTVFGWVGGGCAESRVRDEALEAMRDGTPRVIVVDLDDEVLGVGMPCGGSMEVYVEPVLPAPKLLVLGHGAIAETLARMAGQLEFRVAVNDPLATAERFPTADERIVQDPEYAKIDCDADTWVVIATQHRGDYDALRAVLATEPAYVGLIASAKRAALVLDRLREDGVDPAALGRVRAPCGLDLAAATPQEIALSILSEIVQRRRGGSGGPLAESRSARGRRGE
ncbi:MAG: XdhC family protein [Deltaproteobacteria bacterium]|nr:XdhC family protein [Deltaproteobacteria bacterium]MBW2413451.1 XdhC family protein [Deltaproteobacteria bacterium]